MKVAAKLILCFVAANKLAGCAMAGNKIVMFRYNAEIDYDKNIKIIRSK